MHHNILTVKISCYVGGLGGGTSVRLVSTKHFAS